MADRWRKAAPILLAAAVAVGLAGFHGARLLEDGARARAEAALSAEGWSWAGVDADGLRLTLTGEAPNEIARAEALTLLAQTAGATRPFRAIILNGATIRPAAGAGAAAPEATVTIMRGAGDLTIIGAAPGAGAQAALAAALGDAAPALALSDLSRADAAPGPRDWAAIARPAAEIAANLTHGRVELTPGRLALSGIARDDGGRDRIEAAMAKVEAAGWTVRSDLAPAPAPAATFVIRAETGPGAAGLTTCAASDADEAARIIALAAPLGGAPAACAVGPGAPPDWGAAAEAALAALAALPAGEVSLIGQRARLTARPPTTRRAFQQAAADLRKALPPSYRLASLSSADLAAPEPPAAAPPPPADAAAAPDAVLTLSLDGARLRISGAAPDLLTGESLAAYARATAPGDEVETALTYGGAFPPGWRGAAMAMIAALSQLESGEGRLDADAALIEGVALDPLVISAVQQRLAEGAEPAISAKTRITVSPARLAAAEPLPASRCASELTAVAAADPIGFAPGSADIDPSSAPVLARLAETLGRCAGGPIEIAGHTDSQGSESGNLRLSRARAEAVLAALLQAGARLNMLTAEGYGEAEPIADNATEAGRAQNRRIEFRNLAKEGTR
ncbi:OmpA family protein [Pikeienuella sp. HZG-20]|uniref:OmpA family protein n=1 Tax=Paludibacillus litoralis TaxID=3133267 RepID=UPI0030EB81A4